MSYVSVIYKLKLRWEILSGYYNTCNLVIAWQYFGNKKEKWEHIEMMEKVELRFTKRVKIHFL